MLNKLTKEDLTKNWTEAHPPVGEERHAEANENDNEFYPQTGTSFTDVEVEALFPRNCLYNAKWFDAGKHDEAYAKVAATCLKLHLHPLISYTIVKNRMAFTFTSRLEYPIFLIDEKAYKIVYQPLHPDPDSRYTFYGDRPKTFLHGLLQAKEEIVMRNRRKEENKLMFAGIDEAEIPDYIREQDNGPLKEVILVRQPESAFGLALLGYHPVYVTGKEPEFNNYMLMDLHKVCKKVYQVWDQADSARKQAHLVALEHLEIYNIELPVTVKIKTDITQQQYKLVITLWDFFTWETAFEFSEMMKDALPYQFWGQEPDYSGPKDNRKRVGWKYEFKSTQTYNFLNKMGFYRLPVDGRKSDYMYVKQDGNIIRERTPTRVKNFIHEFLKERRVDVELRDTMYESTRLNEQSLSNIAETTIDFTDNDEDTQYLFFENATLEIKADKIVQHPAGVIDRFVWEKNVINHDISPEPSPFTLTANPDGLSYDIKINHHDCKFFNYLIQVSRIHWRRELEVELIKLSKEQQEVYRRDHHFEIDSPLLSEEERYEQKQHLINKIFALGYFLHRHKVRSKTWAIVGVDDKINTDGRSHGRSGKSLCLNQAVSQVFKDMHTIPGTNPKITENQHIFHGLTKDRQGLIVDDADKGLNFRFFFEFITGNQVVNNKNGDIFSIPFEQLCKMIWLTNFSFTTDPSTEARILYCVFSDFYHEKSESNDYLETRQPKDDFGKDLFSQFEPGEFNQFYNTITYCIQFFLQCPVKLNPPMSNVTKRKLQREMGVEFESWASIYFNPIAGNTDRLLVKEEMMEEFKLSMPKNFNPTSAWFKRAVEAYCKYHGYAFNPEELLNDKKDKRIVHQVPDRHLDKSGNWMSAVNKKAKELVYIQTDFDKPVNKAVPDFDAFTPPNKF